MTNARTDAVSNARGTLVADGGGDGKYKILSAVTSLPQHFLSLRSLTGAYEAVFCAGYFGCGLVIAIIIDYTTGEDRGTGFRLSRPHHVLDYS